MPTFFNFNRRLQQQVERRPEPPVLHFLDGQMHVQRTWTYAGLDAQARRIAAALRARTMPGDRVALLFPGGADFIVAFVACLYAGVIAVPLYAFDLQRLARSLPLLAGIVGDAKVSYTLTTTAVAAALREALKATGSTTDWPLTTIEEAVDAAPLAQIADPSPDTLAFLQYTSGSTGRPKGVMVSHGNLIDNERRIARAFRITPESRGVFWLPHYHDMGLIGGLLQPLYTGFESTFLSPAHFARDPMAWLETISRCGATLSGAPNFAYETCARAPDDQRVAALDLRAWRTAFCGAEPIRVATLQRFGSRFAGVGFDTSAYLPCYGLAEATLFVTGRFGQVAQITQNLSATALQQGRAQAAEGDESIFQAVSCGHVEAAGEVVIADPDSLSECAVDQVGEILVATPSVAHGYWQRPNETAETFHARVPGRAADYLRTGDLGFLRDGELFVTGRAKELIILNGRNVYPHDVESTALEAAAALRPALGVAFSVERGEAEHLVLVLSVRGSLPKAEVVASAVSEVLRRVHDAHGVAVAELLLVRPRAIGRTTSGKIQRTACREQFISGTLAPMFSWRREEGDCTASEPTDDAPPASASTPTETWILDNCRRLLRNPTLGGSSSLVECGASSIELGQLMAAIERRFHVQPSFERVFATPTPRGIAIAVDEAIEAWIASMSEEQLQALLASADVPA